MVETKKITFRDKLVSDIGKFVEDAEMVCPITVDSLVELTVELSHYEEEGVLLYPRVLICDSLDSAVQVLLCTAPIEIGRGQKDSKTVRQALKQCAPLAKAGWSIYIERRVDEFSYGVFFESKSPTAIIIREQIATAPKGTVKAILICYLAKRIVELVACAGQRTHIHLSAIRDDDPSANVSVDVLIQATVQDAPESVRESLRSYLVTVIERALRHGHGALVVVIKEGGQIPLSLSEDGITLPEPIRLSQLVQDFLRYRSDDTTVMLQGYSALLEGMLSCDGITVLDSSGSIIGYNFFVKQPESLVAASLPIKQRRGGARQRAFDALSVVVRNGEILGAFIRSSDGSCDHKFGAD